MPTPPSFTWQTETLRVTAFGPIVPNPWKDVIGAEPDQSVKQAPPMPSFDAGPYNGGRLAIGQQIGRCDIVLSPDAAGVSPNEIANIGDFQLAISNLLEEVFRPNSLATRIAIGAILLHPVASGADGYKFLKESLPIMREFPENSTDIFLQVNVPIPVTVKSLGNEILVNRVLRWNSAIFQVLNLSLGPGVPAQVVRLTVRRRCKLSA
jgi:hypothetical protein